MADPAQRSLTDTRDSFLPLATPAFVALAGAWHLSTPLRHRADAMNFLADDFYYYAKIALNIVSGRGSTFDGVVPSNGYHPLYMLFLLLPASVSSHHGGGLGPFLWALLALGVCSAVVTFIFARKLIVATGCGATLANALALVALTVPFRMFYQGMEVTLTIPLSMIVIWLFYDLFRDARDGRPVPPGGAAWLGLACAAMVLSRLDSAFLVVLLVLAVLTQSSLRRRLSGAACAAFSLAGGLPLAAYVLMNKVTFHTWLPLSGAAKQMRFTHAPSALALSSAFRGNGKILIVIAVLALLGTIALFKRLAPAWRAVLLAGIVFPFLHVAVLCIVSDWQMWGWYHYSFIPALLALMVIAGFTWNSIARRLPASLASIAVYAALLAGCGLTVKNTWHTDTEMMQIASVARQVAAFGATHPGRYAMGDRGGMVAWLLPQPMFQTEGLVEDRAWLETLRSQQDLLPALRARGVRYYVATVWARKPPGIRAQMADPPAGCTLAIEPVQAGPTAPHMQSVICQPWVAKFFTPPNGDISAKTTLIFDLATPSQSVMQP